MSDIAERIARLMQEKSTSYGELASTTKIPKSALHRYITGETPKIPMDRLESIALALNTSPAYLMGWDETEHRLEEEGIDLEVVAHSTNMSVALLQEIVEQTGASSMAQLEDIMIAAEVLIYKRRQIKFYAFREILQAAGYSLPADDISNELLIKRISDGKTFLIERTDINKIIISVFDFIRFVVDSDLTACKEVESESV